MAYIINPNIEVLNPILRVFTIVMSLLSLLSCQHEIPLLAALC